MTISQTKRDTVSTETVSITTHVVHVNLADLLRGYDVTDNVVLMVATPSGRDKRITLGGNFLVPPFEASPFDEPCCPGAARGRHKIGCAMHPNTFN